MRRAHGKENDMKLNQAQGKMMQLRHLLNIRFYDAAAGITEYCFTENCFL